MSLPGWNVNNILHLTIDGSKIDGDLENFPVNITLSSGTGQNNFDATSVFDELAVSGTVCVGWGSDVTLEGNTIGQENPAYLGGAFDNVITDPNATGSWYAYDGGYKTTGWTGQDFGSGNEKCVEKYRIYMDNQTYSPKTWTFQASVSGTWTGEEVTLHTVTNYTFGALAWHEWEFTNSNSYRYYRINVTANNGNAIFLALREMEMMECEGGYEDSYDNRKKIAVSTTVSGVETELYVEIENWDHVNKEACLWTKIPTIVSGTNTMLCLYYDSNHTTNSGYVGDTGDAVAQNVWDSSFQLVMHMAQDPNGDAADAIKDSTSNANHGTPGGGMTSDDLVDGKIGKAIDFDGGNDWLSISHNTGLNFGLNNFTLESIVNTADTDGYVVGKLGLSSWPGYAMEIRNAHTRDIRFEVHDGSNGKYIDSSQIDSLSWTYAAVVRNSSAGEIFIDGVSDKSDTSGFDKNTDSTNGLKIANGYSLYSGKIDEVRVSNVDRSVAWIKATYYSNWNGLISFSLEVPILFSFSSPIPIHLSTVYGVTQQLQLIVTVTGDATSYIYDGAFYDAHDDTQIGSTISGVASGQYASTVMSTPSGIDYGWYLTALSSGVNDTSSTYTFTNRFLCAGTTEINSIPSSGIPVRLYRRSTGELIGSTTSAGVSGTFSISSQHNEAHYAIALYTDDTTNALIYDHLIP